MLSIQNFSICYDDKLAVKRINLEVESGEIYGFIGHNGAGKTTTIKSIAGILDFDDGDILINGKSIKKDPIACKSIMAYIPDNPELYDGLSGIKYLNFIADIYEISTDERIKRIKELAEKFEIPINKNKFKGIYGTGLVENEKVILLKPQTYMNLSGESVIEAIQFYKIDLEDVIVIYDDMDVETGKIKIRKQGSAGSHNGMKSIISEIQTQEFPRIRIGIGRPTYEYDKINYVIGHIPEEELEKLEEGVEKAKEATIDIIKKGIDHAMNKFN